MRTDFQETEAGGETALADLGFMLALIILMAASFGPTVATEALNLPRSNETAESQEPGAVVTVSANGDLRVNQAATELEGLAAAVARHADASAIIWIAADSAAPAGALLRTYAALEDGGFEPRMVFEKEADDDAG